MQTGRRTHKFLQLRSSNLRNLFSCCCCSFSLCKFTRVTFLDIFFCGASKMRQSALSSNPTFLIISIIILSLSCLSVARRFQQKLKPMTWKTLDGKAPLLFAHRGEKVLLPEHTIASYEIASILGADFIEPDLWMTKDDELICYHDLALGGYTNVAEHPEFAHLKTKLPDGTVDWYLTDFTLAQIKTLRIRQKSGGIRPKTFNGLFTIPTFQEFLNVVHSMTYALNRTIGISPEVKFPALHNQNRTAHFMEDKLIEVLEKNGYSFPFPRDKNGGKNLNCRAEVEIPPKDDSGAPGRVESRPIPCPPVVIQSEDDLSTCYLHEKRPGADICQVIEDVPRMFTVDFFQKMAKYIQYISLWKYPMYMGVREFFMVSNHTVFNETEIKNLGGFLSNKNMVQLAHSLGLKIIVYTIYDSRESGWNKYLSKHTINPFEQEGERPLQPTASEVDEDEDNVKTQELFHLFNIGVDAIFVENVAESREALHFYELYKRMQKDLPTPAFDRSLKQSSRAMLNLYKKNQLLSHHHHPAGIPTF